MIYSLNKPRSNRWRPVLATMVSLFVIVTAGCVTNRGTYPIETFTEMHYSQVYRSQEPPRLDAVSGAEVFVPIGLDVSMTVKGMDENMNDAASRYEANPSHAAELYRVNCSVCHGNSGSGDGPIVPFLTDPNSYYSTQNGVAYQSPPSLLETRGRINQDSVFKIITSGINVMPNFGLLLSNEDRWDIVQYIFDETRGLGN